ncbi:MAG: leucyl/phenylalanyl-tRNA--protein transferase [Rhodospirillales bacterium]|nr:leucyl/phenylalanyl-tRNA--protein transferase [Rhodospirillales bacterium]
MSNNDLTLNDVLNAYANGLFPMAERAEEDEFYWYDPPRRGQLSIAGLHIPRRLEKTVRQAPYDVRIDTAFADVIDGCAASTDVRAETWINRPIRNLFVALHEAGFAHSVECWDGEKLVGGLYGLALGGAFMGESMFSRSRDASKIALVHLCARLWKAGFSVLDTQFVNDHLKQFGIYEIPKEAYLKRLHMAIQTRCDFHLETFPDLAEKGLVDDYLENREALPV